MQEDEIKLSPLPQYAIILSGYIGAGKDEVAKILGELGFKRFAFADNLRRLAELIDPLLFVPMPGDSDHPDSKYCQPLLQRLSKALERYEGWDNLKKADTGGGTRQLMQSVGHAVREVFGQKAWAGLTADQVDSFFSREQANSDFKRGVCITDCRMPAEKITFMLGMNRTVEVIHVWIARPGTGKINDADSEQHYEQLREDAEYRIVNDGDLEDLRRLVVDLVEWIDESW